jgi:hypothetical protein
MPLRDHFRPPLDHRHSWDELHGMWPAVMVQHLFTRLPPGYVAAPGVHIGTPFEVDVVTFEEDDPPVERRGGNGTATATWAPPAPTLSLDTDLPDQDEYEVRVYDARRGRRLVAAVEIVSPSNKDRPESRRAFVAKLAGLLREGVCVSVVDVVTTRQFNLYAELLDLMGRTDPAWADDPPHLYAVTLRGRKRPRQRPVLDAWFTPLALGHPLPTLHLWLDTDLGVTLDLEATYEDTCRVLHIA